MTSATSKINSLVRFRPNALQVLNRLHFEVAKKGTALAYRPIWLLFYLSDLCNLKCEMCPHHTTLTVNSFAHMKELSGFMSLDLIEQILRRFPEAMVVSLAGVGEPLTHPDFAEVVRLLSRDRRIVDVTTNGYFLDGQKLSAILQSRAVREVSISLNGSSPEEHLGITGRNGFERVESNVRRLVHERTRNGGPARISVSQVCTPENVTRWEEYVDLAVDLGVDRLYLHNVIDMNIDDPRLTGLPDVEEIRSAVRSIPQRVGSLEVVGPTAISASRFDPKCEWFFRNLAFDPNGNVGSCGRVMNPQSSYGNVSSDEDLWNSSYMQSMRSTFLSGDVYDCCRGCVECQGG